MSRIYLSAPHMGGNEIRFVGEAFSSNWLSTVGPNLNGLEAEFEEMFSTHCVALSSGTAAIHLGLRLLGVGAGDEVFCPSLTFVASANPILYLGAKPVFLDSDHTSWNLDPNILADALHFRAKHNHLPKAVIVVHLYGQSADMEPILNICESYGVKVLEDAAEALGTTYQGKPAGTMGAVGAYSLNGNKIITATGGGMLSAKNLDWVEKARFWATQARQPEIFYQHQEMGYNYRMSNVLAGIGRGQLQVLYERVRQRRAIAFRYRDAFSDLPGISLMPQAGYGIHTNWLSCFLITESEFGNSRDGILHALAEADIEARPVWKPMHLQPLFKQCVHFGGAVSEDIFTRGICLPSSSNLTQADQDRVIEVVRRCAFQSNFPRQIAV